MDNNSLRMGYVIVSRALLPDIYGKQPGERLVDEALQGFIARYNEVTHLPIENKGQISKSWRGKVIIHFSSADEKLLVR